MISEYDFSKSYLLEELATLGPGIYNIYENGNIKHHHHLIVTEDQFIYATDFDRDIDDDLLQELENNYRFGIETRRVKNHIETYTDKLFL